MPRWRASIERTRRCLALDEEGSAAIEFLVVGLLLIVPIVYLVLALGSVQHQALGAEAGARHVARAIAAATGTADADARADSVVRTIVSEYGVDPDALDVDIACGTASASCPAAGATLVVTVRMRVGLPLVPPVFGLDRLASVPIEATAVQKVSRLWGAV